MCQTRLSSLHLQQSDDSASAMLELYAATAFPHSFNDKWRKRARRVVQGKVCAWVCVCKTTKREVKTWRLDALDSFQVHFNDCSMVTPTWGERRESQREVKKKKNSKMMISESVM